MVLVLVVEMEMVGNLNWKNISEGEYEYVGEEEEKRKMCGCGCESGIRKLFVKKSIVHHNDKKLVHTLPILVHMYACGFLPHCLYSQQPNQAKTRLGQTLDSILYSKCSK
jgi:hypothetical protein